MRSVPRVFAVFGMMAAMMALTAATPRLLSTELLPSTCNGHATTAAFPGGPWTVVCSGVCPQPTEDCLPLAFTEGADTYEGCYCVDAITGDATYYPGAVKCAFTLHTHNNADGTVSTNAICTNENCAGPKKCESVAQGAWGGNGTFKCECK